jgi:hypothetical protein
LHSGALLPELKHGSGIGDYVDGEFNWAKMRKLIDYWIPNPRVLHPYPETRFAATHPR